MESLFDEDGTITDTQSTMVAEVYSLNDVFNLRAVNWYAHLLKSDFWGDTLMEWYFRSEVTKWNTQTITHAFESRCPKKHRLYIAHYTRGGIEKNK